MRHLKDFALIQIGSWIFTAIFMTPLYAASGEKVPIRLYFTISLISYAVLIFTEHVLGPFIVWLTKDKDK